VLRRALPVAVATAAFALVPATASAAPKSAPVEVTAFTSYQALANVQLPDGRRVQATVSKASALDGAGWNSSLTLWVQPSPDCLAVGDCDSGTGLGSVVLSDRQLRFDRTLRTVSVAEVTLDLHRQDYNAPTSTEEPVTVALEFTGTGKTVRNAEHSTTCGAGGACQSLRIDAERAAKATLTVDGESGTATGSLHHNTSLDVGARDAGDGDTPPPPPVDGTPQLPPVDGSYPTLPPVGGMPPLPPVDGSYPTPPVVGSYPAPPVDGAPN
jgi:hypothetical protein